METKFFPDKMSMLKELGSRVDGLDINKSAFLPTFGFTETSGKHHLHPTATSFVEGFNRVFGEVLSSRGTQLAGGSARIITFLDKNSSEEEESLEDTLPDTPSEEDTDVSFDLPYAESLKLDKSKKEAKDALEAYGRTFNVELAKNKSFDNMLVDLQEALK